MKKQVLSILAFAVFTVTKTTAQCDFTPDIVPNHPILCPNGKDTLATTEAYDSYQWYRNNKPVPGATHRFYVANAKEDVGALIKVAATRGGCTSFSGKIFVDGWVFNPPIIIESGDVGVYDPKLDALVECKKDTLILTLGSTYTQNIQWYNNFKPIAGATEQSYTVTKNGSYTVCGAPDICPDYRACEALPVNVAYDTLNAKITQKSDTLFASKGRTYQWYYNGKIIAGATANYLLPSAKGIYTVLVGDRYNCRDMSAPYQYNNFKKEKLISISPNPVLDIMHVRIHATDASQIVITDLFGNTAMQVSVTSSYQTLSLANLHSGNYIVQLLNKEKRVITSMRIYKQ